MDGLERVERFCRQLAAAWRAVYCASTVAYEPLLAWAWGAEQVAEAVQRWRKQRDEDRHLFRSEP